MNACFYTYTCTTCGYTHAFTHNHRRTSHAHTHTSARARAQTQERLEDELKKAQREVDRYRMLFDDANNVCVCVCVCGYLCMFLPVCLDLTKRLPCISQSKFKFTCAYVFIWVYICVQILLPSLPPSVRPSLPPLHQSLPASSLRSLSLPLPLFISQGERSPRPQAEQSPRPPRLFTTVTATTGKI